MQKDYFLNNDFAKQLYYDYAKDLPVIDYHNHLSINTLNDLPFADICELWVKADPYKHRLMRICGVPEELITGGASNYDKFLAWCKIFPSLVGTPVFDWSLIELKRVFDIDLMPSEENAKAIFDKANEVIKEKGISANYLLKLFNVEYSAPCQGILDDLSFFVTPDCVPSLRGDDMLLPTIDLVKKLSSIVGQEIVDLNGYVLALAKRIDDFYNVGCKFSDHALDNGFSYVKDDGLNAKRFAKLLKGKELSAQDKTQISCYVLRELFALYVSKNMVVQLHVGAQRQTSTRLKNLAGKAGGYAGIGSTVDVKSLTNMFDDVEQRAGLPRIILFTLNPSDNAVMAILSGSYSKDGVSALVTQGPAWWWCDHLQGINEMLDNFAVFSVLSTFVGMTTDSRSLLSFSRHDYFRRALCKWIGDKVAKGELPEDKELYKPIIEKMCYQNAKNIIMEK